MTVLATKLKCPLPEGMTLKDVAMIGIIGGIGLTVALFVCESAYVDPVLIAAAKMGAFGSMASAIIAMVISFIRSKNSRQ